MKPGFSSVAILGLALLAAGPALAQSAAPADALTGIAAGRLVVTDNGWRASKVIGSTVYNDTGETIGSVDDIILDNSSQATSAILSVGGFLGIGAKLVKVPYAQLRFDQSITTVTTMTTITSTTVGGVAAGTPGTTTTSTTAQPGAVAGTASTPMPSMATTSSTGAPDSLDKNNTSSSRIRLVLPGASKDQLTQMQTFSYP